jgi:polysaccharide biosynthesis/export protein
MNVRWISKYASVAILALFNLLGQSEKTAPLGPGDAIAIHALHVTEIPQQPIRLGEDGLLELPMIGSIKASGLTPAELAAEIRKRLDSFIREPEVSVDVVEVKSRPVSVLGAVKTPGTYQLNASKRLLDMIAAAGGADESAGSVVSVNRPRVSGPIPVGDTVESAGYYSAQISLPDIVDGRRPDDNILILPNDVITVPRAKLVYVIGEVHKSGGFVLRERESMSVLQAISMAEGLTATAGSRSAKIIRPAEDGKPRTEIAVDVKSILAGKTPDVALHPNDVLFVPNSTSKNAALRGVETAIQMGTGIVIWHH